MKGQREVTVAGSQALGGSALGGSGMGGSGLGGGGLVGSGLGLGRSVRLVEIEPGPAGVRTLLSLLPDALAGNGPALAIVPAGTSDYAVRARAAVGFEPLGTAHRAGAGTVQWAAQGVGESEPLGTAQWAAQGVGESEPLGTVQWAAQGADEGRYLVAPEVAVLLPTSGSTGAPRGVLLTASGLLASARATHTHLGGPGAWLLAIPVTGIAGLQVLVRSLVAQCEPVILTSVGGGSSFEPTEFADAAWTLDPSMPAYTALVPTQVARLLDQPHGRSALQGFDAVLVGGARTPRVLLDRLDDAHVPAVTTYGMTETSGGLFYDGLALTGAAARICDPDTEGVGRIELTGPMIAGGYLFPSTDDNTNTTTTFTGATLLTSDVGRLHGAELEVIGRIDDVVQIGGTNVAVSAVEDVLAHVTRDVCVLADPDDTWGARLTAYVVASDRASTDRASTDRASSDLVATDQGIADLLTSETTAPQTTAPETTAPQTTAPQTTAPALSDPTPDDAALADLVRAQLGAAAVPREWVRVNVIPYLPTGKPDRAALRAK